MWPIVDDTIVAIATPPGVGGVGIVRVSGQNVKVIANAILRNSSLVHQKAIYTDFLSETKEIIDSGIAIYFKGPKSFTGEDVLELQAHGSPVVLNLLLQRICIVGARIAEPGEFAKRAFLSGKIDLLQAESIVSLINAQTEQAAKAAIKSLQGEFSKQINNLFARLTELRMKLEATIDFPEDVNILESNKLKQDLINLKKQIDILLQQAQQGLLLSNGIKVVILGEPNVGKSSLLNLLSKKDIAIVTEIAGTTRDVLTAKINIDGLLLEVIDTAGFRSPLNVVEAIGIDKAKEEAHQADLIILMLDVNDPWSQELDCEHFVEELLATHKCNSLLVNKKVLVLINKIDINNLLPRISNDRDVIWVSVAKNLGVDLLKTQIKNIAGFSEHASLFSVRSRHLEALRKVFLHVENGCYLVQQKYNDSLDLLAEELRLAQNFLSEITGRFSCEDLLDKIFSEFCIGK